MKTLKKATAFAAVLAFLLTAILPAAALAADGDEAAESEPWSIDTRYPDDDWETKLERGEASAPLELVTADNPVKETKAATVLTNANVEIKMTAENTNLSASDGDFSVTWAYKWTGPAGTELTGTDEEAPNVCTITRSELTQTGELHFRCTATPTYTYAGSEEPAPAAPASVTYAADFVVTTLGTDLIAGTEDANGKDVRPQSVLECDTKVATSFVDGEMRVQLESIDFSEAHITCGPTRAYVTKYNWSTDAPRERFNEDGSPMLDAAGNRTIEEGLRGWGSNFKPLANWVRLRVSPDDIAAGIWNYTCQAEGVGINSAANAYSFEVTTTPNLMPVDREDYHETVGGVQTVNVSYGFNASGEEDRRIMLLTFRAARGDLKYVEAAWKAGIAPVGATYAWVRDNAVGTPAPASENKPQNQVSVNDISRFSMAVRYEPAANLDKKWDLGLDRTNPWYEASYQITTELIVDAPSISGIDIVGAADDENKVVDDASVTCKVNRGGDVVLRPRMTNDGDLSNTFSYSWQSARPGTDDWKSVTDSRNPVKMEVELEQNGRRLRIKNVTDALDGVGLRVIVTNSQSVPAHWDTSILVQAAAIPMLELKSEPAASMPMFAQVKERTSVKFTAVVTNAINEKNLAYQWEMSEVSTTAGFSPISGANKAEWTTPALTRKPNETLSRYYYRCRVSNTAESPAVGQYTSAFTVEVAPQVGQIIWISPTEDKEYSGDAAYISGTGEQLTVAAQTDNGQRVTYQWQVRRGATRAEALVATPVLLTGETKETLQTGRLDAGWHVYSCIATNASDDTQAEESPRFIFEVLQSEVVPVVELLTEREVGAVIGGQVKLKVNAFTLCGDPVRYEWQIMSGKDRWEAVPGGSRATLTLTDVQANQNGTQYRCRVYNRDHQQYFYDTLPFTLSVWQEADMPKIIVQPKDVRLQNGTTGAQTAVISTTVESQPNQSFVFNWQIWNESGQYWDDNVLQDPEEFVGTESTQGVLHLTGVPADEGKYRCVIENLGGNPAGAQVITNEVTVRIMERHRPLLLTQPPARVYANVGKTTVLRVIADVEPVEELIYTWMISLDAGKTWRNVTSSDGNVATYNDDGSGSAFTTKAAKSSEVGTATLYKCQVRGGESGVMTESRISQVIPKEPSPEIKTVNDTILKVTVNPRTGERFLTGEAVGSADDRLTPKLIREHLDISSVKKGVIEITKNGLPLKDDDPVGTGCVITLLDSKSVPLDEVEMVVSGDLSGNGFANLSQLVKLASAYKGTTRLVGAFAQAADHNGNGKIDLSDIVAQAGLLRRGGISAPTPEPPPEESPSEEDQRR